MIFHFLAAINNSKRNIYMQTFLLLPGLSVILNSRGGAHGLVNKVINCRVPNRNSVPPSFSKFYWNVKVSSNKVVARGPFMSLWMTTLPLGSAGAGPGLQPHVNTGRWGREGTASRHQEAGLPDSPQPGWDVNVLEHLSLWSVPEPHISLKNQQVSVRQRTPPEPKPKVFLGHRHIPFLPLLGMSEKVFFLVLKETVMLQNHSYSCYILATQCSSLRHSIHPIACKICSRMCLFLLKHRRKRHIISVSSSPMNGWMKMQSG